MRYTPKQASPDDLYSLKRYVEEELRKVSTALQNLDSETLTLVKLHKAPTKPQEGLMAYADGSDWNPGSGAGLYQYRTTTWVKVG